MEAEAAVRLILSQAGGMAGPYPVVLKVYDDSTAVMRHWDRAQCLANAAEHVATATELAVIGTANSGCARIEVPVLNAAAGGPLAMVSHANTYPGLLRPWLPGEPATYYPTGIRSYGRIVPSDDIAGAALAQIAHGLLKVDRCFLVDDGGTYGLGVARTFLAEARRQGIVVVGRARWKAAAASYRTLFVRARRLRPTCVVLSGLADMNGAQLIRDKVRILGNNTRVRLLAPDGFAGYREINALRQAAGMYLPLAGLDTRGMLRLGAGATAFDAAFRSAAGHPPETPSTAYAAGVAQLVLAAIAASDGTRTGVRDQLFGGLTVSPALSAVGDTVGIDALTGEAVARAYTVVRIAGRYETVVTWWHVAA